MMYIKILQVSQNNCVVAINLFLFIMTVVQQSFFRKSICIFFFSPHVLREKEGLRLSLSALHSPD